jgi:hypothetical protein
MGIGVALIFGFNLAELAGLRFRSEGHGRHGGTMYRPPGSQPPPINGHSRYAAMRAAPRPPLRAADWLRPQGLVFMPALAFVALLFGGAATLFGRRETFRWGGLLALLGSLALGWLIAHYVLRPVRAD